MAQVDFDIAVYAVNEAATIEACIRSIDSACAGRHGHIAVLLNGTTDESTSILAGTRLTHAALSVYLFPVADKANAINHFLYTLRQRATAHFGIDAYTMIGPTALQAIVEALASQPQALIASGVPVNGRSAKFQADSTLRGGAVDGRLYALRSSFVDRLVEARLQLPLQLYWGDGLLGSMAAHDLCPMRKHWDNSRLIGVPDATFSITPLSIFLWRDVRRHYKREIRQRVGRVQNEAIKTIIYTRGYEALPANANEMAATWLKANPLQPRSLRDRFFVRKALQYIDAQRVGPTAPQLLFSR